MCKTMGGIKSIYFLDNPLVTVENGVVTKIEKAPPPPPEPVIKSAKIRKLIEHIKHEIKWHHITAEEYFQELDNPEDGEREDAKAEVLQALLKHIHDKYSEKVD